MPLLILRRWKEGEVSPPRQVRDAAESLRVAVLELSGADFEKHVKRDLPTVLEYLAACTDNDAALRDEVVQGVLDYLNSRLGRTGNAKFKLTGDTGGCKLIWARYRECRKAGMKPEAAMKRLLAAVEWGLRNWLHKPEMEPYIRPSTLFRPKKFPEYV